MTVHLGGPALLTTGTVGADDGHIIGMGTVAGLSWHCYRAGHYSGQPFTVTYPADHIPYRVTVGRRYWSVVDPG